MTHLMISSLHSHETISKYNSKKEKTIPSPILIYTLEMRK